MMCEGASDACNPTLNVMECKFGSAADKAAFCACADAEYNNLRTSGCSPPSCGNGPVPVGTFLFWNALNQNPDSNCCMRAHSNSTITVTVCIDPTGTVTISNSTVGIGVASEPFNLTRYSDGTCVKE